MDFHKTKAGWCRSMEDFLALGREIPVPDIKQSEIEAAYDEGLDMKDAYNKIVWGSAPKESPELIRKRKKMRNERG